MNIPNGFKLVPVETLKFALGLTCHGFKNRTDQEADKYAALKTITELLESPAPPQPIYDEAKERELFEVYASTHYRLQELPLDFDDGEYIEPDVQYSWEAWEARAKYLEVDHE